MNTGTSSAAVKPSRMRLNAAMVRFLKFFFPLSLMVSRRTVILGVFSLSVAAAFVGTLWNLQGNIFQGQVVSGTSQVIDDGDAGFSTSGQGWQRFQHSLGYKGDIMAPSKVTDSSLAATWTFSNVVAGQYKFYVTFKAYSLLTNKAPYTIKDGSSTLGSTTVNQKTDPTGNLYDGKNWSLLGMYTVKGPTVSITLSRPQDLTVNGMIADSARIERVTTPTETFGLLPAAEPSGGSTYSVCREGFTLVKGSNYPYITCLAFCRDDICNTAEYYQYSGSTACCRCGPSLWCASSSSRYSTPKSSSSRYSTPGAVSSRSSSASSVVACANEGDMITEANMRPCCSGLISVPFIQPDTSNQCFNMSFNSICTRSVIAPMTVHDQPAATINSMPANSVTDQTFPARSAKFVRPTARVSRNHPATFSGRQ